MIRAINHTADAGFEIDAPDLQSLLAQAGCAMLDILYERDSVEEKESRKIQVTATATDILLHDFLAELLQIAQYEYFPIARIEFEVVADKSVAAELFGEPFDSDRHRFLTEIKAVTYHQLVAEPGGSGWFGRVIFDL